MNLRKLRLSDFTSGDPATQYEFTTNLLDDLTKGGFVKLIDHGIQLQEIQQIFRQSRSFFQIDDEEKCSIAHPSGDEPQRGWSAVGTEKSSSLYQKGILKAQMTEDLKDAREHFDQGSREDKLYPNRWPQENILPGFRETMEATFEKFEKVAEHIVRALEVAFDLPDRAFLERITHEGNEGSSSEFRLNHYPAIDVKEIKCGRVSRIWPHFDLGVITLLFQDQVGGLEFEDRDTKGAFIKIECNDPVEMVVNVSETLQRWTNGHLPAGLHRVSIPENFADHKLGRLPERYSIAYFCKANRDASVGALKNFVPEDTVSQYKDMSALQYHQKRLQSAY